MNIATEERVDIKENILFELDETILSTLLKDHSSGNNLMWATDDYNFYGNGYSSNDFITVESITGNNGEVIKPRVNKTKDEQVVRIRQKAEVFTPSWICNAQNNLIDNAWFEREDIFNKETNNGWITNCKPVQFPKAKNKTWQDYVALLRLEITCGEAPYLTSRYDATTGDYIEPQDRIGLLDRKLRVINENVETEEEWENWATIAVKSIYGYDWQGDNVFIARENILIAVAEYFEFKFDKKMPVRLLKTFAEIISWNIWQMDGLKFVVPNSCHKTSLGVQMSLFAKTEEVECEGCTSGNKTLHNGIYCVIMDWQNNKKVRFVDMFNGKKKYGKQ